MLQHRGGRQTGGRRFCFVAAAEERGKESLNLASPRRPLGMLQRLFSKSRTVEFE